MAVVAVVAVIVAACSRRRADGPETTVPTLPATVATTAVADPFAVPAVIDADYVNRVLAALNKVEGDLVRDLVERNVVGLEANIRLRAVYNDPKFKQEFDSLIKLFSTGADAFKRPPGDRVTIVSEIVNASRTCILVKTKSDYSSVVVNLPPKQVNEIDITTLRPTQPDADPENLNPTPWSVSNDETISIADAPPPRARCAA